MHPPSQREEALFEAALSMPPDQRAAWLLRACGDDAALNQRLIARLQQHRPASPSPFFITVLLLRLHGWLWQPRRRTTPPASDSPQVSFAPDRLPAKEVPATVPLEPAQALGAAASVKPIAVPAPLTEGVGTVIGRYKILEQIGEGGFGVVYAAEQREPVKRRVALKIIKLGMDTKQVVARFEAERQALALMDHPNIAKVLDAGATDTGRPFFVMELVRGIRITDYCDQNNLPTRQRLDLFTQVCGAIQHAHQKGIIHRDIKPSNILVTLQEDGTPTPKVIDFGIAKATQGQLTDKTIYTELQQFIGTPAYMSPEQAEMMAVDIDTRSDIYSLGVLLYELLTGKTPFDPARLVAAGLDEIRRVIREEDPPRPSTRLSMLSADERTTVARRRQSEPPKLIHLLRGDLDWIAMKCLEKDRTRRYETASGLAMDVQRHLNDEAIVARPPSSLYRFQKLVRRNKVAAATVGMVGAALALGLGISTWLLFKEKEARQRAVAAERTALTEADMLGELLIGQGNASRVEASLRQSLAMQQALLGEDSERVIASLHTIWMVLGPERKKAEGEELLRDGLRRARRLTASDPSRGAPKLALVLHHLALVLEQRKASDEARRLAEEALALYEGHPDWPVNERLHTIEVLRSVLEDLGDLTALEALYRKALAFESAQPGGEDSVVPALLAGLAGVHRRRGELEQAESLLRKACECARKLSTKSPAQEPEVLARVLRALANVLRERKALPEARLVAEEAVAMFQRHADWPQDERAVGFTVLASVLRDLKDFTALQVLVHKPAEQGYPFAQYQLGLMYANGEDVPKDPQEAINWYRKAAEQGYADAQNDLGLCYVYGQGIAQDYARAVGWFRKAAEQGGAKGQNNLGWAYKNGLGIETNYTEALKWFRLAASQSDMNAERSLGWMYANGEGVARDAAEAVRWYRRAAQQGDAQAQCCLGSAYDHGEGVAKDAAEASKWYRVAAEQGDATAQCQVGWRYANGTGITKDGAEALRWYRKAAEQGNASGQAALGWSYFSGIGVDKDQTEALTWFRKAAEQGDAYAQYNLASMYALGQGVTNVDEGEAIHWYRKAAEQGDADARTGLAWLLATSNDPKIRNGSAAVSFAEMAVTATGRKDPNVLATLAAAYAEAGDFTKAVAIQEEAIGLAGDENLKKDFTARLERYRSGAPYRRSDN